MQINNVNIYGLEESIIASSYPMLKKPLSGKQFKEAVREVQILSKEPIEAKQKNSHFQRAFNLAHAISGSGHDCFLKGIVVQFDCHAPQYFWQQLQRYHFIDIISSMSKMHRINKMGLTDACMEETNYEAIHNANESINYYDAGEIDIDSVLANIPMGLEYTARLTTNYLQLKTIYKQRKNHRSEQWRDFCQWIKILPLAKELIINED